MDEGGGTGGGRTNGRDEGSAGALGLLLARASVVDAHGRRVPIVGRSATTARDRWRMHAALERAPGARRAGLIAGAVALPAFIATAVLVPLISRAALSLPPTLGAWRIMLAVVAGGASGLVGPLVMIAVARQLMAAEIARFIVGRGACASCGYPLEGVPRAEDGCVVCPECGAAWRREEERIEPR